MEFDFFAMQRPAILAARRRQNRSGFAEAPPLFAYPKVGELPTSRCNKSRIPPTRTSCLCSRTKKWDNCQTSCCNQSRIPPTRANCPCWLAKKWVNFQSFPYHHSRKYSQRNSLHITGCYFYANLYYTQSFRLNQHFSLNKKIPQIPNNPTFVLTVNKMLKTRRKSPRYCFQQLKDVNILLFFTKIWLFYTAKNMNFC